MATTPFEQCLLDRTDALQNNLFVIGKLLLSHQRRGTHHLTRVCGAQSLLFAQPRRRGAANSCTALKDAFVKASNHFTGSMLKSTVRAASSLMLPVFSVFCWLATD